MRLLLIVASFLFVGLPAHAQYENIFIGGELGIYGGTYYQYTPRVYSGHGSIYLEGFNSTNANKVKSALGILKNHNSGLVIPGTWSSITPYSLTLQKLNRLEYAETSKYWGYTYFGTKRAYLSSLLLRENAGAISGTIFHEADHHRYGKHTCGSSQDRDDKGPFGLTSYYYLKLYRSSKVSASDRSRAASIALSRRAYNLCGNSSAKKRVWDAYRYNRFPTFQAPNIQDLGEFNFGYIGY